MKINTINNIFIINCININKMTSIYDIPYKDIKNFLLANKKTYDNETDAYNKTLILLKDKKI